jgi:hypothetical protein
MIDQLILPIPTFCPVNNEFSKADEEVATLVSAWINERAKIVEEGWSHPSSVHIKRFISDPETLSEKIIQILTHRDFNFQSKRNLNQIIPKVRENLVMQLKKGTPIKFFLLFNGGYRASSFRSHLSLIFEPDQTELMLLYQIALLNKKILSVYDPGIEFFIVINNGVSHWVNDVPLTSTENYANQLRSMIQLFGAENKVRVLLQSELVGFHPKISFEGFSVQVQLSEKEHRIVERFLGRTCSLEEAKYSTELYQLAEAKWDEDLSPIATAEGALMLRQVAHKEMLSFRPFPGGAIRVQNGSFGFQYQKSGLKPKLITSQNNNEKAIKCVYYDIQWPMNHPNN